MFRTSIIRMVLALAAATALVAFLVTPYISEVLSAWYRVQSENHAKALVRSLEDELGALVDRNDAAHLRARLAEVAHGEPHLVAIKLCRADGTEIGETGSASRAIVCQLERAAVTDSNRIIQGPDGRLQISEFGARTLSERPFRVVLAYDLAFADWKRTGWRRFVVAFVGVSTLGLLLIVALMVWWLLRRWAMLLLSDIRSGRLIGDARSPEFSLPILSQIRKLLLEAEETQRLEIDYRENWTPQALKQVVEHQLDSCQVITVSNREPYSHMLDAEGHIKVQVPASGMVTALEPVMRACSGVWIAHGSGTADRQVVDAYDRIPVPPDDPAYVLRRVWLSEEEEQGYYLGFSNEGLWPLCHLAYVRPAFRESDWQTYQAVNRKFAAVVAKEAKTDHPVVLIQDFHFSLLPGLVRERIPRATIGLFWHVPWPNAETFGVCPWKREILAHMLRADILGFHTLQHCLNMLDTVDRYVECHIDREHLTVTLQGHTCHIAPYPISIEWPPRWLKDIPSIKDCRDAVCREHGIDPSVRLGVGVERWDFTKGIVERCQALELFLERNPGERGRVTLIQVAEPSRSRLPAYQAVQENTIQEVERINERFATQSWRPIVLVKQHQDPYLVFQLYRAADFCLVTSLHDGMNLVAKEFVAARDDEDGVLILSSFTGASRELVEALPVNPFDAAETAAAIATAMKMSRDERRQRMRLMRQTVKDNNVYRWAGRMLVDIARIRQRQALRVGNRR
jgi:trehalose-6-phosphate synthase